MANGAPTVSNGLVISGVTTSTTFSGSGASLTNLNASNIASGTVPTARLGSGTANSSTFLAGDSTFKTITGTTINNNADNRLITGSGTANTLEGEANLTFSGSTLKVNNTTGHSYLKINSNDAYSSIIHFGDQSDDDAAQIWYDNYQGNGMYFRTSENTPMSFFTNGTQRLRINSNGQVLIGTNTNPTDSSCNLRVNFDQNTSSGRAIEITHNTNGADKAGAALGLAIANGGESTNAADLTFQTASNGSLGTRMTISSDGQVTTPAQCSFRATKSGGGFNNGSHIFVWDQIQHNVGSNYNNSNGRFTAPVDGTYILYAYSIYQNNATNDVMDFRKNGSTFAGSRTHFTYSGGSAWDHVNSTMIISLSANDYIEVYVSDQNYHGGDWTAFCGHLLG